MKGSSNVFRLKVRLHGSDVKDIALESGREYTFGRGSDCDIQLEDQPGISRTHFKVFESPEGGWAAQVVSKFGDINLAGNPVQSVKLDVGTVFKLSGYDFLFFEQQSAVVTPIKEEEEEAVDLAQPEQVAVGQSQVVSAPNLPAPSSVPFEGSDEATRVMEMQTWGEPYVRIVEGSGREETIKLEGRKWLAGREEGSQILLNDRKASRRQFELISSPQGNFVRDLGSSNGTQLNGMPLAPDELKPLRSGDVVQVGQLQIYFEIRDPNFERRLQVVPKEVMQQQLPAVQPMQYEMINYPVVQGPGGAVRVNPNGMPAVYQAQGWDAKEARPADLRAKRMRFILICAIVGLGLYFLLAGGNNQPAPTKQPTVQTPQQQAFAKLTPQKQQFVKEAYILGKNLYIQGKGALAAEQFAKIHELLKDGYEDSLAMAQECEAQRQQEIQRQQVEEEMRQAAQNKITVSQNLEKCKPVAARTYDESELRTCLAPTYSLDPMNPTISEYIDQVKARIAERDAKQAQNRAYANKIALGESLFHKAEEIEKRGDNEGAVDAYRKHLAANLPDPKGYREISKKKVGLIEGNKAASIAAYLSTAEQAFVNHDYKTAINNINKVKGLDAYNQQAAELNGKINREKDSKLREIYEESILNEGLGQVDQAKANWKKIMDMDHPDGIYYKRAKNKLRSLGGL